MLSKRNMWSTISLIAQLVFLMFIAGVGNFFTKSFDPSYIFSSEWYADTLTQILYNYMTLLSVFNYKLNKIKRSDMTYITYLKKVNDSTSTLHPDELNPWLLKFNTGRRINAFINKYKRKLNKLEAKVKDKDIVIWEKGTEEEKKNNKYCRKRTKYSEFISNEYIETNKYVLKLGFGFILKPISSSFITNGYNNGRYNTDNAHIENGLAKFIKDLLPKTILLTIIVVMLRSIILDLAELDNTFMMIVTTLTTLLPMALHANTGWSYADVYFNEKVVVDLRKREEFTAQFKKDTRVGEE